MRVSSSRASCTNLDSKPCANSASAPGDRDFEREIVDHLMPLVGHDEGVAEENPKQAVGGDRIGLRHDDHAGLEHLLEIFCRDVFGDNVRLISDKINAVALRRP